jgi:maltose alpha-D-glucosyltransferase/alpha-amylase
VREAIQHTWIERIRIAHERQGRRPLIEFLQRQRWFGGKGKPLADVRVEDAIEIQAGDEPLLLALLLVEYRGGIQERYLVPVSIGPRTDLEEAAVITELPDSSGLQRVCDATSDDGTWRALHDLVAKGKELAGESGCLLGRTMPGRQDELAGPVNTVKVLSTEQSNTSVVFDQRVIMKLIRKVETGVHPDSEVLEFLTTQTSCRDVPPLLGLMTYEASFADAPNPDTIAVVQRFVPNSGNGWSYTMAHLKELQDGVSASSVGHGMDPLKAVRETSAGFMAEIRRLGSITGNLHLALSSRADQKEFCPELITTGDVERWRARMTHFLAEVCRDLRALPVDQRAAVGLSLDEVEGLEAACRDRFGDLGPLATVHTMKIRHHGDYHLGQVLKTDNGFVVIDFEGEPSRPLDERRAKVCPLKDVAGMLRSFNYAAQAALKQSRPASATDIAAMTAWEDEARIAFLDGYRSTAIPGRASFLPASWEDALRVLRAYELDKALYELRYEMWNRPDWLSIPLAGIRSLVR